MIQQQNGRFDHNASMWNQLPSKFDTRYLEKIIHLANRTDALNLSLLNTFLILDIRHMPVPENTLIFDTQRGILKTVKTSTQLKKHAQRRQAFGQVPLIRCLATELNCSTSKLPLINGDVVLVPLGAVTRGSTDWVGCQQVSSYRQVGKMTEVTFFNRVHVRLQLSHSRFHRQYTEAHRLQNELLSVQATQNQYYFGRLFDSEATTNMRRFQGKIYIQFAKHILKIYDVPLDDRDINFGMKDYFW